MKKKAAKATDRARIMRKKAAKAKAKSEAKAKDRARIMLGEIVCLFDEVNRLQKKDAKALAELLDEIWDCATETGADGPVPLFWDGFRDGTFEFPVAWSLHHVDFMRGIRIFLEAGHGIEISTERWL